MRVWLRQLLGEQWKLRRTPTVRLVWVLPLLFTAAVGLGFERPLLGLRTPSAEARALLEGLHPKLVVALWGGFIHPLALALLPALIVRPEHRFRTWRHLFSQPAPRAGFFLAKAAQAMLLLGLMLALLGLLLAVDRQALSWANPALRRAPQGMVVAQALAWLWLGSLPALAIYLWVAHRVGSFAVPVVLGLVGFLMAVALTGQELAEAWKRDLNPWVLPYACAEQVIHTGKAQQTTHGLGGLFQPQENELRLPSGKRVRVWQNLPDEVLFPPPPPTPARVLASFSVVAAVLLLTLGALDARRPPF